MSELREGWMPCGACRALVDATTGCTHYRPGTAADRRVAVRLRVKLEERLAGIERERRAAARLAALRTEDRERRQERAGVVDADQRAFLAAFNRTC